MKKIIFAGVLLSAAALASAKLPPASDEAKSKAAEATAKAAWTGKVAAYQNCKAQDRAAAHYYKKAKDTKPAQATPPCADPGAFSYVPAVAAKPPEAAAQAAAAVVAPAKKP